MTPTKIYVSSTLSVLRSGLVKAAAHITGGGLPANIVRVLPDSLAVHLDASSWTVPPVFGWISQMVFLCYNVHAYAVDSSLYQLIDSCGTSPMPIHSAGAFLHNVHHSFHNTVFRNDLFIYSQLSQCILQAVLLA